MSQLNVLTRILAYADTQATANPNKRIVDWKREYQSLPVSNAKSEEFELTSLESKTVFSGSRSLTIDNTTVFNLTALADEGQYRLAWTGTGTAPAFRTARTVAMAGDHINVTANSNRTLTMTSDLGSVFGAVVVGDTVFIPGASTGDTALFNILNEGEWTVLTASGTTLVLTRPTGVSFSGTTEAVMITVDTQVQFYSVAGVQVGDTLDLVSGYQVAARRSFSISAVTARRVDFTSNVTLANESAILPGTTSTYIYSFGKNYLYIESDQEIAVQVNGDSTELNRVVPLSAGDSSLVGVYYKIGSVFSLVVKNRTTSTANVLVISAQ